jgi:GDP-D-mannose 3', 5'-epimerase
MKALILGAGGFIGGHLYRKLKKQGYELIVGVDIKNHEYFEDIRRKDFSSFIQSDLRSTRNCDWIIRSYPQVDEIYQLSADMGGLGFLCPDNDADVMHNSATINLNILNAIHKHRPNNPPKIFYSSSACVYPEHNQMDPNNPICSEESVYPAFPDLNYGWEKLFSERLYEAYARNKSIPVRIARFHNIFGPQGTYKGGREKAPAAICRKVAEAPDGGTIEIWGDGEQTRSFLYIDECLEGVERLMKSDVSTPLNIGSEEMVSINQLAKMIIAISGKDLKIKNIKGPEGVRGRCSDNRLIEKLLHWKPSQKLEEGLKKTYAWIYEEVRKEK